MHSAAFSEADDLLRRRIQALDDRVALLERMVAQLSAARLAEGDRQRRRPDHPLGWCWCGSYHVQAPGEAA